MRRGLCIELSMCLLGVALVEGLRIGLRLGLELMRPQKGCRSLLC